jgi:hypothetical protein
VQIDCAAHAGTAEVNRDRPSRCTAYMVEYGFWSEPFHTDHDLSDDTPALQFGIYRVRFVACRRGEMLRT